MPAPARPGGNPEAPLTAAFLRFEHDLRARAQRCTGATPVPLFRTRAEVEFARQAAGEHGDGSTVGVIGRICDELIVGGDRKILIDRISVVCLENLLGTIVEL